MRSKRDIKSELHRVRRWHGGTLRWFAVAFVLWFGYFAATSLLRAWIKPVKFDYGFALISLILIGLAVTTEIIVFTIRKLDVFEQRIFRLAITLFICMSSRNSIYFYDALPVGPRALCIIVFASLILRSLYLSLKLLWIVPWEPEETPQ